ncbi:uncharacterized protein LOC110702016 [Chenopodium quinoa]|uniref:uncharacterized protein LOC110702016 n=1 Tax=Chenopodium quinoa TaxID=63459 RepID=UPI000B789C37|nr:uncharacterized protein LOC110702016 [Chenopodium quinoa]
MEGLKIATIFFFVLVIVTHINNVIANIDTILGADKQLKAETIQEINKLDKCANKCKTNGDEDACRVECIKKSLNGASKFKKNETKYEMLAAYKSLFCMYGCHQTMSQICEKKDEEKCKKDCIKVCIDQPTHVPDPKSTPAHKSSHKKAH